MSPSVKKQTKQKIKAKKKKGLGLDVLNRTKVNLRVLLFPYRHAENVCNGGLGDYFKTQHILQTQTVTFTTVNMYQ